ncbi:MAG TPA: hypothetical protein VK963_01955 [Candidatus Saccharimonadales bacterium]|nr:hypothetical protein [Candidatus Saccharimonadales bacterium]
MDDKGWAKIVEAIDVKFGITSHSRAKKEPLPDKPELEQTVSYICFSKDGREYKLERVAAPAIIDRKSHFHKAAGSGVRFENIYDPDETSYKTNFYVKTAGEWEPIDPSELAL